MDNLRLRLVLKHAKDLSKELYQSSGLSGTEFLFLDKLANTCGWVGEQSFRERAKVWAQVAEIIESMLNADYED